MNIAPSIALDVQPLAVAVIGLGDIAEKAYLPTLGTRAELDLRLATRNRDRLDALADAYRIPRDRRFSDLDDLLAGRLDGAFVHVATEAHPAIVGRLLDAGVPTYVDKPLAATLAGSRALVEHAERVGVPLMVGFNRRYVPAYADAARLPRDIIVLQKNEADSPGDVREIVFDDFIHVVDTLRFLLPGPATTVTVSGRVENGLLHHVALTLAGNGFTAVGLMNRVAGAKGERLQIAGQGSSREIFDLVQTVEHDGRRHAPGGWTPVARQRGIEQICTDFLGGVRGGRFPELRDALATHELCELVVAELLKSAEPAES